MSELVRQDVADDRRDDHAALGFVERCFSQLRHRAQMLGVDIGLDQRSDGFWWRRGVCEWKWQIGDDDLLGTIQG